MFYLLPQCRGLMLWIVLTLPKVMLQTHWREVYHSGDMMSTSEFPGEVPLL